MEHTPCSAKRRSGSFSSPHFRIMPGRTTILFEDGHVPEERMREWRILPHKNQIHLWFLFVTWQQVARNRGQRCGNIKLTVYLVNETGPVLRCWTSTSLMNVLEVVLTLVLIRHLHYPNDIDRSLNETTTDTIRKYNTTLSGFVTVAQRPENVLSWRTCKAWYWMKKSWRFYKG